MQAALNSTKTAPLEQNVQNLQLDQVRELGAPAALFPEVDEVNALQTSFRLSKSLISCQALRVSIDSVFA